MPTATTRAGTKSVGDACTIARSLDAVGRHLLGDKGAQVEVTQRGEHGRMVANYNARRMGKIPGRQTGRTAALAGHAATTAG